MAPRPVPRSQRLDIPWIYVDLAYRRTEFIFPHLQGGDMPVRLALACAYAQGLSDAADALAVRDPASKAL